MKDIFTIGNSQDISKVLANRDRRAAFQRKLVAKYPKMTLVAAKLNIPGPIKNNKFIAQFFVMELQKLEKTWLQDGILFQQVEEWIDAETGPERFYLVQDTAMDVKKMTTKFEEEIASHRLFDLDVLVQHNSQILPLSRTDSGQLPRKCFVCGRPAKACGRSRRHSVEELQRTVNKLINKSLEAGRQENVRKKLVYFAQRSLLYEVIAWPKPGLVDPVEHGAHTDMDIFTFINSSLVLRNYLDYAAKLGLRSNSNNYQLMFAELREFGKRAEQTMLKATKGVNTHKGAIFSLGILVTAVANSWQKLKKVDLLDVQKVVKKMLANLIENDLQNNTLQRQQTAGEQQYQKYRLTGIRGEAQEGYPTVFKYGLPTMEQTSGGWNERIIQTFLVLARHTKDSNLIKRAGTPDILSWKDKQLDQFMAAGGLTTSTGYMMLKKMEKEFSNRHLSLGGSADLVIITIFLTLVKEG